MLTNPNPNVPLSPDETSSTGDGSETAAACESAASTTSGVTLSLVPQPPPRDVVNVTPSDEAFKTRLLAALGRLDQNVTSLRHATGALMVGASDLSPVLDDIHRVQQAARELKAVRAMAGGAAHGTPKFAFYLALNKDGQRRLDSARASARRAQTTMQRITDAMARSASPEMLEATRYNNKIRDAIRLMGKMKFETRQWQKLGRVDRERQASDDV